ncbi:MAG: cytochrome P450 [Myxococcales bacterium]|nr:cytochrome P450 [Myxococcales bacterium]
MTAPRRPPTADLSWRRLATFVRSPLDFYVELSRRHGDYVHIPVPGSYIVQVTDPDAFEAVLVRERDAFAKGQFTRVLGELLGDGLIVSDGERWRENRRIYQPAFTAAAIRGLADAIVRIGVDHLERWPKGRVDDVHRDMEALALDVVRETLLGAGFADEVRACTTGVKTLLDHLSGLGASGIRVPAFIPTPGNLRFRRALAEAKGAAASLLRRARARPEIRAAFLDGLIEARAPDGRPALSDDAIRDEILTVIMAGHQTTALTLTFAAHLLAAHPQIQERLQEEVDRVLGDELVRREHVESLTYTGAILKEVLRLYTAVVGVDRQALRPVKLGPYEIPAGANVALLSYVVHRDPRWYPEPEVFRPERWLAPAGERAPPRFAYLPFGGGNRTCVGNHFATLEGTLILATLAQRFTLAPTSERPLAVDPGVTIRPRRPITLRVERRAGRCARQAAT